jgi:hypothetical protein
MFLLFMLALAVESPDQMTPEAKQALQEMRASLKDARKILEQKRYVELYDKHIGIPNDPNPKIEGPDKQEKIQKYMETGGEQLWQNALDIALEDTSQLWYPPSEKYKRGFYFSFERPVPKEEAVHYVIVKKVAGEWRILRGYIARPAKEKGDEQEQ